MEKKHFGTVGYDAHIIRVSSECDIQFSGTSYRQHVPSGNWGWIDNFLGNKRISLFIQKEKVKTMSNEQRVTFTPRLFRQGFLSTRLMKELLYKWEEVSKANNSNLTPAVMLN